MSTTSIERIEKDFQDGQSRLSRLTDLLSTRASLFTQRANLLKLAVVILGSIIVSREAADKLFPTYPNKIIGFYAVLAILTAVVGGILSSFKYDSRAGGLKVLAVSSNTLMEDLNNQWNKVVYLKQGQDQIDAALELLVIQDAKTGEISIRGADLTNVTKALLNQQSLQKRDNAR